METSILITDSVSMDKSYRLVMKGDVADLTIGDIKKNIAKDSGMLPKNMVLVWKGNPITGDAKFAREFKICHGSELVLQARVATQEKDVGGQNKKSAEIEYYAEILLDLFSRWEANKSDAALEKRVAKALVSLQREMEKVVGSTPAARASAAELVKRVKGTTCDVSGEGVDTPLSVLRDLHPVVVGLHDDNRTARGWDADAKAALKVVSAAFLRLVRMREGLRGVKDASDRWAQGIVVDYAYDTVRSSVARLGDRVAMKDSSYGVETVHHPTLTAEDIEEMEAVHVEAKGLLDGSSDTYCALFKELQDLMKDEAKVPGTPLEIPPEGDEDEIEENPYRARLVAFYSKYNPDRLSAVDDILSQYSGNEETMFRVLEHKYAPPPAAPMESSSNTPPPQPAQQEGACVVQ